MNVNPHNFRDGEMCRCVGGPFDGQFHKVSVLFPFLDGGIPSAALRIGDVWYTLDQPHRQWILSKDKPKSLASPRPEP